MPAPLRSATAVVLLALCAAAQAASPAAQATPPGPARVAPADDVNPHRIAVRTGAHRCELGRSLHVSEVSADQRTAVLRWDRREYTMRAVHARSGAMRYEDAGSGLVWLVIPGKSMLLDARQGQRLAAECRT
ncbi:MAG TPA: MliC family protein [Burkholderiaceae bacterium]|nr:MliC family protein [Burkholderiaceae bacterium]